MRLLLDAHVLLWWLADDARLPPPVRRAIASADSEVLVSAATTWEIAVKKVAGRLDAPDDLLEALDAGGLATLPISAAHTVAAANLPPHHPDPFDRMIIAQARLEGLTVVTVDRRFADYDVELLPAATG